MKAEKLNLTGVVYSDRPSPKLGDGQVKGWLALPNVFVTASHCGPSVNDVVRIYQDKKRTISHTRTIKQSERLLFDTEQTYSNGDPNNGDVTVCVLDSPFPEWAKCYSLAKGIKGTAHTVIQTGAISTADLQQGKTPWLYGKNRSKDLVPGDSGLPWFMLEENKWCVVSHSSKGMWGEGPMYSHSKVREKLIKLINKLAIA